MTRSVVSLFCGGGVKSLGAVQSGYTPVLGVEMDEAIAAVYADNIGAVTVAKVEDVDPRPFAGIDLLLASPVCTRASVANANRGETGVDAAAAEGVCRWLREARPERFVMENVTQYREFDSCKSILRTLTELGYWWSADNCNFADYAVPQTRRRLVVRAVRDAMLPALPAPTPWIGWYAAIEDILHTLPASRFADWQVARLRKLPWMEDFFGQSDVPREGLPLLQSAVRSEDFHQWGAGVVGALLAAQILRPEVYGGGIRRPPHDAQDGGWIPLSRTEGRCRGCLRDMWFSECWRRSPQGWKSDEQLAGQLAAYLSKLSHEGPSQQAALRGLWQAAGVQGVLQQALSPLQEVWRSAFHEDQSPRYAEAPNDNARCSCGQGEDKEVGREFGQTVGKSAQGSPAAILIEGDAAGDRPPTCGTSAAPSFTLKGATGGRVHRAFLVSNGGAHGDLFRLPGHPAPAVTGQSEGRVKGFLVSDFTEASGERVGVRHSHAPAGTVRAGATGGTGAKAFLVEGRNTSTDRSFTCREASSPSVTVLTDDRPSHYRAWLEQGRVVSLTPRALARLQTLPDTYRLPESRRLACQIIGNGFSTEAARRIIGGLS